MSRLPRVLALLLAVPLGAQCPGGYSGPAVPVPASPPPPSLLPPAGPRTPGPAGPSAPQPSGPRTGAGIGPSAPIPAPGTGGAGGLTGRVPDPRTGLPGLRLDDDLTTWELWWEFNQDAFVRWRGGDDNYVQTGTDEFFLGPTRRDEPGAQRTTLPDRGTIVDSVLPALKQALDESVEREVTTACMLAMGRIGIDAPQIRLVDTFARHLANSDQSIREQAAVAIGLAAPTDRRSFDMLIGLAQDSSTGRKLRSESVDERTRAFAAYGLGLAAWQTDNVASKDRVLTALATLLEDAKNTPRSVKVAAVHAIGCLRLGGRKYDSVKVLDRALEVLETYFEAGLGAGERLAQAHVPAAVAKLIGRDHPRAEHWKRMLAAELAGDGAHPRSSAAIAQSCALALGQLARPNDDDEAKGNVDVGCSHLLANVAKNHRDLQTRHFAILALGQIGGAGNRALLLETIDRMRATPERAWYALALGVHAFARGEAGRKTTGTFVRDRLLCDTLGDTLERTKDPLMTGAIAIAAGLSGATDTAARLRSRLLANAARERLASHLCVGLALLDDREASATLREIIADSYQRPELLEHAAIALGRLDDDRIAESMRARLAQDDGNIAATAAAAKALMTIGDRRQVVPLLSLLKDKSRSVVQRAGAAAALGGICDARVLPWNAIYSANTNYRAAVDSLTDRTAGILDLL